MTRGHPHCLALALALGLASLRPEAVALAAGGVGSTTTTTTMPPSPTTTLPGSGVDVTGGARLHAGFGTGSSDSFVFDLAAPAVLVAETSDGADHCSGDTILRLFKGGVLLATDDDSGPGSCSRLVVSLTAPGAYQIKVTGYGGQAVPAYVIDVEFVPTTCGNGIVELLEQCDDGNTADGDCCSATCTKEPDGSPCNDGLLCDGDDTCVSGYCNQHSLNPCPGTDGDGNCAESCSDVGGGCGYPDPDGSFCDNGLFCDGVDRCHGGLCSVHNGNPCRGPDGDGHCAESCKEATDTCSAADPDGTPCDDGVFCNGADTCSGGSCSVHVGNPCVGPDGDGNCSESCDEVADDCTGPDPNGSVCNDGLFCTGADHCSGGTCSVHAGSGCPGPDGDANCAESCNEAAKNCTLADPNGSACNDGVYCDGTDSCAAGACTTHSGNPCPGPDGDANCAESCNEAAKNCTLADPNGSACNDGLFCDGADSCSAGACTTHAGNPCPGPDGDGNCSESCSEAADNCTAADPNGSACDDGLFCDGADSCSAGACSLHVGNPCPGPDGDGNCSESCNETADDCSAPDSNGSPCNDGLFCNGADTCSGGTCSVHAGNPCPGPDGDANCAESCDETADACTAADPNGSACNDGLFCDGADSCSAGACTTHAGDPCPGPDGDGNCSESCNETVDSCTSADPNGSACNDGLFCDGADTCSGGTCSVHAGNPCPGPDGDGNCSESCDEAADNCAAADANGSACNDGLFCDGADTCSGGTCSVHAGSPCPGPDGDGNCAESCDEAADNCAAADPNGSACNDGLFCDGADTCSGGTCSVHAGDPCPGPDGDANCAESCNETVDSCTSADPNGSACNDGLFCNGADTCSGGTCSAHAGSPCPGPDGDANCAESCNEAADDCSAPDSNGAPCNDGIFCNGADTCSAGACSVHAGNPCPGPDGDGNCSESCNEAADACTAPDTNGSPCNDGLFCDGADTCSGGACSVHAGNPCPGPDGDGNCSESCDEAADSCKGADPDGSSCDDGLFCNGADTCLGGGCVQHAGTQCPGADGDANCAESCSDSGAGCNGPDPLGSPCDDGIFCNGTDHCSGGSCSIHDGNPCPGPDGDGDCAESCNEAAKTCTAPDLNGSPCDDGIFCDGADQCSGGACSVHAGDPCPGPDGDADCSERCDEQADACSANDPDGSACNDGIFCNGADTCSGGSCSIHAGDPCPGPDGDGNCSETCSETAGACTGADPNGTPCDDGLFCDGADVCSGGSCSLHGGNPCTGPDGDGNCSESCNEAADSCNGADPDGSACDDGVFCDGADTCSGGSCTHHAGSPCPGPDGDANCAESCNEGAHDCSAPDSNGSPCNDGIFCDGADTCSGGSCSVHAGDPCTGPDGDGNCSESCSEQAAACSGADPNGSACDDGLFCDGADVCLDGACSLHAGNPCTGPDGDGNCSESCNEGADSCTGADPNGSACDDGLFCDGADTCSGGTCSHHAGSPCPGPDGDANCSESCSELNHTCTAADANGSPCSDGIFCNGADTCSGGSCSVHAGDPCPGPDGDGDCSETCDEASAACDAPDPDSTACEDGDPCTHGDVCNGSGTCLSGTRTDCDDGDECTTDICSSGQQPCLHEKIPNCPPTTTTTLQAATCGDVNGDDKILAGDALAVLKAAVGGPQCQARPCICDANGSGTLTASDALLVLRKAVLLPVALNCPC